MISRVVAAVASARKIEEKRIGYSSFVGNGQTEINIHKAMITVG
jgi:hypothetical protein